MADPRNSAGWDAAKEQVRQRDEYRCQNCDREGSESEIDDLQVHHIRAVEDGGTNDLDNLVLVCNSCHWQIHTAGPTEDGLYPTDLASLKNLEDSDFVNLKKRPSDTQRAVIEFLYGRGTTKREEIINAVEFVPQTVTSTLKSARICGWVSRPGRGQYRLSRELLAAVRMVDEAPIVDLVQSVRNESIDDARPANPGEQAQLDEFFAEGELA